MSNGNSWTASRINARKSRISVARRWRFRAGLTSGNSLQLRQWIEGAKRSEFGHVVRFAYGLQKDTSAVQKSLFSTARMAPFPRRHRHMASTSAILWRRRSIHAASLRRSRATSSNVRRSESSGAFFPLSCCHRWTTTSTYFGSRLNAAADTLGQFRGRPTWCRCPGMAGTPPGLGAMTPSPPDGSLIPVPPPSQNVTVWVGDAEWADRRFSPLLSIGGGARCRSGAPGGRGPQPRQRARPACFGPLAFSSRRRGRCHLDALTC